MPLVLASTPLNTWMCHSGRLVKKINKWDVRLCLADDQHE